MISVITVVRNGAATISKTIESVCEQSVLPIEYIIIDGGSTDGTVDLVHFYMTKYSFIKLISERDEGIYDAMNKGICQAKGEVIGIINSDDFYEANALAIVTEAYKRGGSGCYYGILRINLNDIELKLERNHHNYPNLGMIPHPATFITRDIYEKHGLYSKEFKFSSDLDLISRLISNNVVFHELNYIIANFSLGGVSSTHKAKIESLKIRRSKGWITSSNYYLQLITVLIKRILH